MQTRVKWQRYMQGTCDGVGVYMHEVYDSYAVDYSLISIFVLVFKNWVWKLNSRKREQKQCWLFVKLCFDLVNMPFHKLRPRTHECERRNTNIELIEKHSNLCKRFVYGRAIRAWIFSLAYLIITSIYQFKCIIRSECDWIWDNCCLTQTQ